MVELSEVSAVVESSSAAPGTLSPGIRREAVPAGLLIGGLIVGLVVGLVVGLLVGLLVGRGLGDKSQYLRVTGEFSGSVVKVSGDGQAISIQETDGTKLNSRILNATEFDVQPGDNIKGTIVEIPLTSGNGSEEAVVIAGP